MKHIMDVIPKLIDIIELIEKIKQEICEKSEIDYKSQDARLVALDTLHASMASTGMWISGFNSLANRCSNNNKLDVDEFLNSVQSKLNLELTEKTMFKNLSLGFMTSNHFTIENLFYNILKHNNSLPERKGYWHLVDSILEICSIQSDGDEKKYLTAFANIRNSLHANSIHRNASLSIKVAGMKFDFIRGKKLECTSWEHLITLFHEQVKLLETILLSENIINIKDEIKDEFASEK